MGDETDIVRDIIDRFVCAVPEISVECAYRIEQDVRARWGGGHVYIARDPDRHARQEAVVHAWRNGVPVQQVVTSLGIDRSTVYRLLRRK